MMATRALPLNTFSMAATRPLKAPLEMMMLGIRSGEHIVVRVEGPDEATAAEAIRKIMATF